MSGVSEFWSGFAIAAAIVALAALLVISLRDVVRRANERTRELEPGDPLDGDSSPPGRAPSEPPGAESRKISALAGTMLPSGAVRTRHPIVLVHGYFGFDSIGVSRLRRDYFLGVRTALERSGHQVFVVRVSAAGSVELRAAQLAEQIKKIPAARVNVIAHSMGGLDARYAITRLGLAEKVASLVTIGTPHRGTPVADRSASFFGEWRRLRKALGAVGANVDGLYDLTTRRMEEFNQNVTDVPSVTYASVVGAVFRSRRSVPPVLSRAHAFLERLSGPNDGLVPATSQRWGRVISEIDANHWAQIGWAGGFDAKSFYVSLAAHLAESGH